MDNVTRIVKPELEGQQLKECPFCGGGEIVYMEYNSGVGLRWAVVCCGCMATIDPGYAQNIGVVQRMWNRREVK